MTFVILGLLLSFVTTAASNSLLDLGNKTYKARISAKKAIVFADENMLSPLGYIANGKQIVVGKPQKINPALVPLIISGRLAFIQISDLNYEDEKNDNYSINRGAPREHNFDLILQPPGEKLSENNSFYFNLHKFSAGTEIKELFFAIENAQVNSFSGFDLQLIHRKEASSYFYGAGIGYSAVSTSSMKFSFWVFSPTLGYTPFSNKLFLADLFFSLDFATNSQLDIKNSFTESPTGFLWGPQINARLVFFPDSKYHFVTSLGYRKYNISGLLSVKNLDGVDVLGIQNISSVSASIGFGMEFL